MAGQGRSVEQWNALARSTQRRWLAIYDHDAQAAIAAYTSGAKMTSAQRGHGNNAARTPERPERALKNPLLYPNYVARHGDKLNEIARRKGLEQHGTGPTGESKATQNYAKAGGDFTWVVPASDSLEYLENDPAWHLGTVTRATQSASDIRKGWPPSAGAQLLARRSRAAAGDVIIVDMGEGVNYRYQLWFATSLQAQLKAKRKAKKKKRR